LKVTGPAKLIDPPASAQVRASSGPPEKQWKTTARGALLAQHPHDVVVGVAVVDHQGGAGPLGDGDVRAERLLLQAAAPAGSGVR
jgi:hypothetical protein